MAKSTKSNLFKDDKENQVQENIPAPGSSESELVDFPIKKSAPNDVDDVQDIDLSVIRKKRFRIDGDSSRILELNTSDLGIATRLDEAYDKLNSLVEEVGSILQDTPTEEDELSREKLKQMNEALKKLDTEMRRYVDYIFDANVSEVCAPFGNMWDPVNGAFRYEHIIDTITRLYENNINAEFGKIKARVNKRVSQYTKKHRH